MHAKDGALVRFFLNTGCEIQLPQCHLMFEANYLLAQTNRAEYSQIKMEAQKMGITNDGDVALWGARLLAEARNRGMTKPSDVVLAASMAEAAQLANDKMLSPQQIMRLRLTANLLDMVSRELAAHAGGSSNTPIRGNQPLPPSPVSGAGGNSTAPIDPRGAPDSIGPPPAQESGLLVSNEDVEGWGSVWAKWAEGNPDMAPEMREYLEAASLTTAAYAEYVVNIGDTQPDWLSLVEFVDNGGILPEPVTSPRPKGSVDLSIHGQKISLDELLISDAKWASTIQKFRLESEIRNLEESGWSIVIDNTLPRALGFAIPTLKILLLPSSKNIDLEDLRLSLDRIIVTAHRLQGLVASKNSYNDNAAIEFIPASLLEKYKNEGPRGDAVYYSPEQAREHRVIIREGRLYKSDGRTPFDTENARARHSGLGVMTVVLDMNGRLYGNTKTYEQRGEIFHASYVNGNDVAFAGELRVINGYVVAVTDKSGHYKPSFVHSAQFIEWLKKQGVDLTDVRFLMVEGSGLKEDR
jgi:hypothetical protein